MEFMKELMKSVIVIANDLVAMFAALTIITRRVVAFKEVVVCYVIWIIIAFALQCITDAIEKSFTKKKPEEQKD